MKKPLCALRSKRFRFLLKNSCGKISFAGVRQNNNDSLAAAFQRQFASRPKGRTGGYTAKYAFKSCKTACVFKCILIVHGNHSVKGAVCYCRRNEVCTNALQSVTACRPARKQGGACRLCRNYLYIRIFLFQFFIVSLLILYTPTPQKSTAADTLQKKQNILIFRY